ncbi:Bicaudal D protein [Fasciola hepatica]|uniref:Bicaudal D protein n=1 Tax=Fasciola hepatica TaxID=6192 RepID=A0A2H1CHN7_FASHE|nr:Bicaudal D protein [Fasciola hepatica]
MVDAEASGDALDKKSYQYMLSELNNRESDLVVAAQLGQSLLEANEVLRQENAEMLESFRQQIHQLENERNLLRVRLDTVEHDYDNQIKELQTDIVSMRLCVQKQKHMYQQLENEKAAVVGELTQQNQNLSRKLQESSENETRLKEELKSIRTQCAQRKTSIQDHFHVLDSLRMEITSLREEKVQLESRLSAITEERNNLLVSLADSHWQINVMEQIQSEQKATINSQDVAIANLQARANNLQEDIKSLTSRQNKVDARAPSARATSVRPHHSLLAELAEQRMELLNEAVSVDVVLKKLRSTFISL